MVIRRISLSTVLVAALLAAGCARDAGSGTPPPAASSPAAGLPAPSGNVPSAGGARTITGTVTAGVEPDCLLVTDGGTDYLLVFENPAMRGAAAAGATVTVTGRTEPEMMSTCQQGTPFIVTSVRPN